MTGYLGSSKMTPMLRPPLPYSFAKLRIHVDSQANEAIEFSAM
jgi:hypothetical protein